MEPYMLIYPTEVYTILEVDILYTGILHMFGFCHSEIKSVLLRGVCFGDLNLNHGSYEFYYTVLMLYVIYTDIHMYSKRDESSLSLVAFCVVFFQRLFCSGWHDLAVEQMA